MKVWIAALASYFAGVAGIAPVAAQGWTPGKNVELIVGAGAGGGNDRTARAIERIFQEQKLVPATIVVMNKPGAGGGIGQNYLNQRAGDANYLMITNPALITNYLTGLSTLNHGDVTPVAQLYTEYVMLAVKADSPIKAQPGCDQAPAQGPRGPFDRRGARSRRGYAYRCSAGPESGRYRSESTAHRSLRHCRRSAGGARWRARRSDADDRAQRSAACERRQSARDRRSGPASPRRRFRGDTDFPRARRGCGLR